MALLKLCSCGKPINMSLSKCDQCQEKKKEHHNLYDKHVRDKDAAKFYSSKQWQFVREQAITRDLGLCLHCLKAKKITRAKMVDHIIPVKVAWELRLVIDNLQSLCNSCHAKKTVIDKKTYGRGYQ